MSYELENIDDTNFTVELYDDSLNVGLGVIEKSPLEAAIEQNQRLQTQLKAVKTKVYTTESEREQMENKLKEMELALEVAKSAEFETKAVLDAKMKFEEEKYRFELKKNRKNAEMLKELEYSNKRLKAENERIRKESELTRLRLENSLLEHVTMSEPVINSVYDSDISVVSEDSFSFDLIDAYANTSKKDLRLERASLILKRVLLTFDYAFYYVISKLSIPLIIFIFAYIQAYFQVKTGKANSTWEVFIRWYYMIKPTVTEWLKYAVAIVDYLKSLFTAV